MLEGYRIWSSAWDRVLHADFRSHSFKALCFWALCFRLCVWKHTQLCRLHRRGQGQKLPCPSESHPTVAGWRVFQFFSVWKIWNEHNFNHMIEGVITTCVTFDQDRRTRKHQGQPGSSSITNNGLSFGSSLLSLWRALAGMEQVYWTCRSFEKMRKRTKTDLGLNASCEVSNMLTMSLEDYCVPGTDLLDHHKTTTRLWWRRRLVYQWLLSHHPQYDD